MSGEAIIITSYSLDGSKEGPPPDSQSVEPATSTDAGPGHNISFRSLEKKRARDRRAQQNLRNKRLLQVASLEQQLALWKQQNDTQNARVQELQKTCLSLRHENEELRSLNEDLLVRQNLVDAFVASWRPLGFGGDLSSSGRLPTLCTDSSASSPALSSEGGGGELEKIGFEMHPHLRAIEETAIQTARGSTCYSHEKDAMLLHSQLAPTDSSIDLAGVRQSLFTPSLELPLWTQTPFPWQNDVSCGSTSSYTWKIDRQQVLDAADTPTPLELLYGSTTNGLADALHRQGRALRCCDAERLAGGWLAYLTIKWTLDPSQARFDRMPDFMKPVKEQMTLPHDSNHDYVLWPQLRANLITKQGQYDAEKVTGLFACCLRVRWPWGQDFLEPQEDGKLSISSEFYNTFMSLDGWGLTSAFSDKYPELLEGLDYQSIWYEPV